MYGNNNKTHVGSSFNKGPISEVNKNFATTNDFDDISLTPSLKLRVLNIESQRTDIGVEETINKTDVESSLNTSPIIDVNRNFGTINGFDYISFTPSMRKYMVNI